MLSLLLFVCVRVFVCGSVTTITRNCVHPEQTRFVGKGIVTLNFGRPAPPEGGLRRGENFWLRHNYYSQRAVFASL